MQSFVDYYKVLELPPNATADEINKQYRHLALLNHPDKGGSERQMQKINDARRTLADPGLRLMYDEVYREFYHPHPTAQTRSESYPSPQTGSYSGGRPSARRRQANVKFTFVMRAKHYLKYQLILDLAWLLLKLLYGLINILRQIIFG